MARYILAFEVDDTFYREFSEQGSTEEILLEQLKLDIQDQLDEYDLPQLLTHLVSSKYQEHLVVFTPKKCREEEQTPQILLVEDY